MQTDARTQFTLVDDVLVHLTMFAVPAHTQIVVAMGAAGLKQWLQARTQGRGVGRAPFALVVC